MRGLAHELGRLAEVDDNALKQALRHAAQMLGSGIGGYTIGLILDNFANVEVLLP